MPVAEHCKSTCGVTTKYISANQKVDLSDDPVSSSLDLCTGTKHNSVHRRIENGIVMSNVPVVLDSMTSEMLACKVLRWTRLVFHLAERSVFHHALTKGTQRQPADLTHRHSPPREAHIYSFPSPVRRRHLDRKNERVRVTLKLTSLTVCHVTLANDVPFYAMEHQATKLLLLLWP